jgi:hypothetical protein
MINRLFAVTLLAGLAAANADAMAVEKITIGNTNTVVRTVTGTLSGDLRELSLMDDIYHNELIETGSDSATEISFLDDTTLTVGANASLVLDKFIYDPDPSRASFVLTATAGVFRFASGTLPKKSYTIHTPTATIGIRGTVLTIAVQSAEEPGSPGRVAVSVTVDEGAVDIVSCGGEEIHLDSATPSATISGDMSDLCHAVAAAKLLPAD